MADSVAFYSSFGGWEVACQYIISGPDIKTLWSMTDESRVDVTLLQKRGASGGRIKLVQFAGASRAPIRDPRRPWDLGLLSVDFLVADVQERFSALTRQGVRSVSPAPVRYSVEVGEVEEVLLYGPSAEMVCWSNSNRCPSFLDSRRKVMNTAK
jgi:hypothetical protein